VVPTVAILSRDHLDPDAVDVRDANTRQRLATMVAEVIDLSAFTQERKARHAS
jgi:hypothetical protein